MLELPGLPPEGLQQQAVRGPAGQVVPDEEGIVRPADGQEEVHGVCPAQGESEGAAHQVHLTLQGEKGQEKRRQCFDFFPCHSTRSPHSVLLSRLQLLPTFVRVGKTILGRKSPTCATHGEKCIEEVEDE